ncbi:MAG: DUF1553 domain-containing protein [Planctomycetes bacterium]|nr:DUF1553 domain-containing protein [Planctomycetota bacterium]
MKHRSIISRPVAGPTLAAMVLAIAGEVVATRAAESPSWNADVAPLLKRHCVKCHGPAKAESRLDLATASGLLRGGEHGSVVAPHDPDSSRLWLRVRENEMPPDEPLGAAERDLLRRWISEGAPGMQQAGTSGEHWAFQALDAPRRGPRYSPSDSTSQVPPSVFSAFRDPLDESIASRLRERGLVLAEPASEQTLTRRLSLNLLGIPPPLDEVEVDEVGQIPDGSERQVDRFLASPRYGERWGKYWLDAAGYSDSNGYFNADSDRPLAYRYRDYVIRSWNRDLGFDEFVRQQLAGDEIAGFVPGGEATPESIELLEATHYLRNGQDGSGESDGNPDEVRIDRYTALESSMQIVASSLLGLTIQCAKCHDHKFEPITQREYYQFQSILYPVFNIEQWQKPNDRFVLAPLAGQREEWQGRVDALSELARTKQSELTAWVRANRPRGESLFEATFDVADERLAEHWSNTAPGDDTPGGTPAVQLDVDARPGARIVDGQLWIMESGAAGDRWLCTRQSFDWTPARKDDVVEVTFDLIADTLPGGGTPAARIGYLIAAGDFHDQRDRPGGNILIDGNPGGSTAVHLDYPGADARSVGEIGAAGYRSGRNYGLRITNLGDDKFRLEHLVDGMVDGKNMTLSSADLPDGAFAWEYCCDRSFVIDNLRIELLPGRAATEAEPDEFIRELKAMREATDRIVQERDALTRNPPGKIYWASDMHPEPPTVHWLERGNYAARKDPVEPMMPAALSDFTRPFTVAVRGPETRTSLRRLALADWMTATGSKAASLLARVQVNRIWQYHFGEGLVATADNLGLSGAPPTHPELLDRLAAQLQSDQWSVKRLQRRIVLSATYRQSSAADRLSLERDPDGRLLSRFPLHRLDAESIRDALLAASGELDTRMFGSYVPTSRDAAGEVVVPENATGARRRSIYLYQRRTQVLSLLAIFDAPSLVFNSVSRPRSTMPLQALSLLNAEFVANRARALAVDLTTPNPLESASERPVDDPQRIAIAYRRTLGRPPRTEELDAARLFLREQAGYYPESSTGVVQALADLCQSLMASNEFLYVE